MLHASPFAPFSIVLATRKIYHVGNPDVLSVTIQGQVIHQDAVGPTTYINPVLITEIVRPTATNEA
jgi:hypothetical protein